MKKNKNLYIANMILTGLVSIMLAFRTTLISISAYVAMMQEGLDIVSTSKKLLNMTTVEFLIPVVLYVVLALLNFKFANSKNKKALIILTVINSVLLIGSLVSVILIVGF
jgi:hypothetical protein